MQQYNASMNIVKSFNVSDMFCYILFSCSLKCVVISKTNIYDNIIIILEIDFINPSRGRYYMLTLNWTLLSKI